MKKNGLVLFSFVVAILCVIAIAYLYGDFKSHKANISRADQLAKFTSLSREAQTIEQECWRADFQPSKSLNADRPKWDRVKQFCTDNFNSFDESLSTYMTSIGRASDFVQMNNQTAWETLPYPYQYIKNYEVKRVSTWLHYKQWYLGKWIADLQAK